MFTRGEAPATARSPDEWRIHPLLGGGGRTPRGASVVARERLSMGHEYVLACVGGRHLEVLQWARANGCQWNERTCTWAAWWGRLEILKWAHENGCPLDAKTCAFALMGGHLDVLQWARANGCQWNEATRNGVVELG